MKQYKEDQLKLKDILKETSSQLKNIESSIRLSFQTKQPRIRKTGYLNLKRIGKKQTKILDYLCEFTKSENRPIPNLILDLDETLISGVALKDQPLKFLKDAKRKWGRDAFSFMFHKHTEMGVIIRDGVRDFLKEMAKNYRLWVYSNGAEEYVKKIVKELNREGDIIHKQRIIWRRNDKFMKSIRDIKGQPPENMIILDDITPYTQKEIDKVGYLRSKFFFGWSKNLSQKERLRRHYAIGNFRLTTKDSNFCVDRCDKGPGRSTQIFHLTEFLKTVAYEFYKVRKVCPMLKQTFSLKSIIQMLREEMFPDKIYGIVASNIMIENSAKLILTKYANRTVVSNSQLFQAEVILVDNNSGTNIQRATENIAPEKIFRIQCVFDFFFDCRKIDLLKYKLLISKHRQSRKPDISLKPLPILDLLRKRRPKAR